MCFPYSSSCYRSIHPSIITSEIKRKFSLSMRVEQKKNRERKNPRCNGECFTDYFFENNLLLIR